MSRTTTTPLFAEVLKQQPTTELLHLTSLCVAELERRAKREPRAPKEAAN